MAQLKLDTSNLRIVLLYRELKITLIPELLKGSSWQVERVKCVVCFRQKSKDLRNYLAWIKISRTDFVASSSTENNLQLEHCFLNARSFRQEFCPEWAKFRQESQNFKFSSIFIGQKIKKKNHVALS